MQFNKSVFNGFKEQGSILNLSEFFYHCLKVCKVKRYGISGGINSMNPMRSHELHEGENSLGAYLHNLILCYSVDSGRP